MCREGMTFVWASTSFVLVFLIALLLQILIYSPISPDPLQLPLLSSTTFSTNNILQSVSKIGEGIVEGPEDVCVDKRSGTIYTATRDGWIKKLHKNGSWEDWKMLGGKNLLGLAMSMDGSILVCDAIQGLLKVGPGNAGVSVLTSQVAGSKICSTDCHLLQDARGYKFEAPCLILMCLRDSGLICESFSRTVLEFLTR